MKILITGVSGFIGYHLALKLLKHNFEIIGVDNMNNYYNNDLKFDRLKEIEKISNSNFKFRKVDINDESSINKIFTENKFDVVIHLAAQAGVRYSIDNPKTYIDTNIKGFFNVIDASYKSNVDLFLYASSSSVYGLGKELPYNENSITDKPASLYAATKKSTELIAHSYSHLYGLKTIGLRFFTVYGPWGRPDMAYYTFTQKILNDEPIQIFNNGLNYRDFTYIEDIIDGIEKIINKGLTKQNYSLINIGNNESVSVEKFISILEKNLNKKAIKEYVSFQKGDVEKTWADINLIKKDYEYSPKTSLEEGLKKFCKWYLNYNKVH